MAEEAEGQAQEQQEEEVALQISPSGPAPKSGSKLMYIIVGSVVFLIILIATILIFIFTSGEDDTKIRGTEEESGFVELYNKRMQYALQSEKQPLYTDPFNFNVNMKNGRNYIHLTFRASVYDSNAVTFLESRTPLIDDKIISVLKNKLPQEIRTRTGLEMLKQEILIELNQMFPQQFIDQSQSKDRMPVKDILITEYFIQ